MRIKIIAALISALAVMSCATEPAEDDTRVWPSLYSYTGDSLAAITFPIGGLGTGTVSLGGRGNLRDFEIMNRPAIGYNPTAFFVLRTETAGETDIRVIETLPAGAAPSGWYPGSQSGWPHFRNGAFNAAYPLGRYTFSDSLCPLDVALEAFNPLIPHDPENSGLPVAVLRYRLTNPNDAPVTAAIAGVLDNCVGNDGAMNLRPKRVNEFRAGSELSGLFYSGVMPDGSERAPQNGTVSLTVAGAGETSATPYLPQTEWFDRYGIFYDDFAPDGMLTTTAREDTTYPTYSSTGALAHTVTVPAGGEVTVTFMLTWHFPHRTASGCGWLVTLCDGEPCDDYLGNYYAAQFTDAWDVAVRVAPKLPELETETVRFVRTIVASDTPKPLIDAALSNISSLRTQLCFRTPDGNFFGFEGCSAAEGCCFGSCDHVWNYETTSAYVFPSLARTMRAVEFDYNRFERGYLKARVTLPLTKEMEYPGRLAAADGHMGKIIRLYREWRLSGDDAFIKRHWPGAKQALSFAWVEGGWDADCDGVMEGIQHTTYDVELYGPNTMITSMYLGALRSCEEMARYIGDDAFADSCRTLFESGSAWCDANLFDGEYYVQEIRPMESRAGVYKDIFLHTNFPPDDPWYQYGGGCLSDQLLGQYMAHTTSLGSLFDAAHIQSAVSAVYEYNFHNDFRSYANSMRTYVLMDEPGLLVCTWPKGNKPDVPLRYGTEVWSGIEYAAAALMICEGMIDEGVRIVEAARSRQSGVRRSPWDEVECGRHYARAMAAWSPFVAYTGFDADAVHRSMRFAPADDAGDYATLWMSGTGWGEYRRMVDSGLRCDIEAMHGAAELETLTLGLPESVDAVTNAAVSLEGEMLNAQVSSDAGVATVTFNTPVRLHAGQTLEIHFE